MKNKKGFIAISIIYSFFIVFLMLLTINMTSYAQNRILLGQVKKDMKKYSTVGLIKAPSNTDEDLPETSPDNPDASKGEIIVIPGQEHTGKPSKVQLNLSDNVKLGDYISMTPTSIEFKTDTNMTGYSNSQIIKPQELNIWRVIQINNDGTLEMVSEYVSGTQIFFEGKNGYLNFSGYLNRIAKEYENSKYTIKSRSFGYNGQTEYITNTSKISYPSAWNKSTEDGIAASEEPYGAGDDYMYKDLETVRNVLGTIISKKADNLSYNGWYWLTSRRFGYIRGDTYCWLNYNTMGTEIVDNGNGSRIYCYYGSFQSLARDRSIRPILTLKANIMYYDGDGTAENPFILE